MHSERASLKNNLPADRTATRVAVMTVNPYLLHVYWRLSRPDQEDIQVRLGDSPAGARPVLRFYDITRILFDGTNANRIFDVEVDIRTMNWNVPIWSAGKSYVIDLGYKLSDGSFCHIARSNIVNVPRGGPSPQPAADDPHPESRQLEGLAPVTLMNVHPENPVEAPRRVTAHEIRKGTGEHLKDTALSYPFDLVCLSEERFSFGVSSPSPNHKNP